LWVKTNEFCRRTEKTGGQESECQSRKNTQGFKINEESLKNPHAAKLEAPIHPKNRKEGGSAARQTLVRRERILRCQRRTEKVKSIKGKTGAKLEKASKTGGGYAKTIARKQQSLRGSGSPTPTGERYEIKKPLWNWHEAKDCSEWG